MKLLLTEVEDGTRYPNWLLRLLIAIALTAVAYALSGREVWDAPTEQKYGKILATFVLAISLIQEYIFMVFLVLARKYLSKGSYTTGLISVFLLCCIAPTTAITVPIVLYLRNLGMKAVDIPPFKTEPLFLWQTTIILTSIYACCYFKQWHSRYVKGDGRDEYPKENKKDLQ